MSRKEVCSSWRRKCTEESLGQEYSKREFWGEYTETDEHWESTLERQIRAANRCQESH